MNESSIMDTRPASIRKSSALPCNYRVPWLSRAGTLRNAPGPLRLHLQSYWWPRWSWAAVHSHLWTSSWRVSCVPHYLSGSITRHPLTRTHYFLRGFDSRVALVWVLDLIAIHSPAASRTRMTSVQRGHAGPPAQCYGVKSVWSRYRTGSSALFDDECF